MTEPTPRQTTRSYKHGHAADGRLTRTYCAWVEMRRRCRDPRKKCFPHYGGRGISVCQRWDDFQNFLADMGEVPVGLSIDRIDNDGNYEPGNCRWTTPSEQARNRRTSNWVEFRGVRRLLSEWDHFLGLSVGTIRHRIKNNWPPERAFTLGAQIIIPRRRA